VHAAATYLGHACAAPVLLLLQVLLSDQSGFLPHVYKAQGNELVSLTPWQVRPQATAGLHCSSQTVLHAANDRQKDTAGAAHRLHAASVLQ
jgi:hypothetical protein